MDKPATNAVRQVLMNELGLTRESIREEAAIIIRECVAKELSRLSGNGALEKMLHEEFRKLCSNHQWDSNSIRGMVLAASRVEVEKFVRANLRILGTGEG